MLNKLREKIERNRDSKKFFWVILVLMKDFCGKIRGMLEKIFNPIFLYLYGPELIRQLTPYNVKGFEEKVRLGSPNDGGYILPINILPFMDVAYTYGVGNDISFEKDFLRYKKISFRLYDHTVDKLPFYDENFFFKKQGIAARKYGDFDTFQNHLFQNKDTDKMLLLKIDIEGGEWELIDKIIEKNHKNIIAIILELHGLDEIKKFPMRIDILKKINSKFTLVHIHGNNYGGVFCIKHKVMPKLCELTLINNNFIKYRNVLDSELPSKQDFPNCPYKKDIKLDFWIETKQKFV